MTPSLSVVIPVFNEQDNLLIFHQELKDALANVTGGWEILYVDDGSSDKSYQVLQTIAMKDDTVTVVSFRRNFGQTLAMGAGVKLSRGKVLVFLDADLQNDPRDIPRLLEKIADGFDVVSGWRKDRRDNWMLRTFPSLVANKIISWITGVHVNDYGCTIKAFRREIIDEISFSGYALDSTTHNM
jgi:glycosyltransferase involved in cell wall biosynthesis